MFSGKCVKMVFIFTSYEGHKTLRTVKCPLYEQVKCLFRLEVPLCNQFNKTIHLRNAFFFGIPVGSKSGLNLWNKISNFVDFFFLATRYTSPLT